MRKSFGSGAGGPMGGGGSGGGGMIKTVHRVVRAGVGGAGQEPFSQSTTAKTNSNHNNSSRTTNKSSSSNIFLSSNNNQSPFPSLNHPIAATAATNWAIPTSPTSSEEFDWECVDGGWSEGGSVNRYFDDFVFGSAPSKEEVDYAVSSLQQVLDPIPFYRVVNHKNDKLEKITSPTSSHKSGSEVDWMEPSMELSDSRTTLQLSGYDKVYDAFHLLQTEPAVQRMVISLSSDRSVWDAVMNNEVVRELRELRENAEKRISEKPNKGSEDPNLVTDVIRWIFVNTKAKMIEMVEKITKILNELLQPPGEDKAKGEGGEAYDPFGKKLRSSFLISVVVLMIVVVSRTRRG